MTNNITGTFDTRRNAEMAVERLVQEFGVERTDIFIAAQGAENTSGVEVEGSDAESGGPSEEARDDGAYEGAVTVSVDVNDEGITEKISAALHEFEGTTNVEA